MAKPSPLFPQWFTVGLAVIVSIVWLADWIIPLLNERYERVGFDWALTVILAATYGLPWLKKRNNHDAT